MQHLLPSAALPSAETVFLAAETTESQLLSYQCVRAHHALSTECTGMGLARVGSSTCTSTRAPPAYYRVRHISISLEARPPMHTQQL